MNDGHIVLKGLYDIWLYGILKKCCHRACAMKHIGGHRISVNIISNYDTCETGFEVIHVICKTKDSHYLGCNGDDKMVFSYHSVSLSSHSDDNVSELTVIHILAAFPVNALKIDPELVALLDMIIK